jgi:GNAT superfamily N-acetyltransferase
LALYVFNDFISTFLGGKFFMSLHKASEVCTIARLREIRIPEDYVQMANLFNLIEPGSTTVKSLEEEDKQMPITSNLKKNENGHLIGFGRTRVIAENVEGQIIGYGASYRAPWVEPGQLASVFCVHPEFRGQGVGSMILSYIENWANEQGASVLLTIVMDWIDRALLFVQKRGFSLDAHVFDFELDLNQYDPTKNSGFVKQVTDSGIQFVTLADVSEEKSLHSLYDLFVETSKDNPGQYDSLPPYEQWCAEFLPEDTSRKDWVFIALDGNRFVGVTQLFKTEEVAVIYTNYTGVKKEYRGRGIAKALKIKSIHAAIQAGAKTMTTDSEENNGPMQHINRSLGYIPGSGHYRIIKQLK